MENSFYSAFDQERLNIESPRDDYRSCFQIDRDRILHTDSFRSLQSKTQVFWSGEYDFYRTRLTHSLEVAQIGRSISYYLKKFSSYLGEEYFIDSDLVEAICLSHDLGHPPYGHAGENVINRFMHEEGGFEGNAQTLRLITERIFSSKNTGMNPSRAFLDGVLKYKTLWSELKSSNDGMPPKNHFIYDEQVKYLDWVYEGRDFPIEYTPGKARDAFKSIECQIMDWADDVAYSLNDLADSIRAGFLDVLTIENWAAEHGHSIQPESPLGDLLKAIRRGKVESFVGRKIGDFIQAVELDEVVNFMSGESNRYRYTLLIDAEQRAVCDVYKALAYQVVFQSSELSQLEYKGGHMLSKLWNLLHCQYVLGDSNDGFRILPDPVAKEIEQCADRAAKSRVLCDYIVSLTDAAVNRLYKRLFTPGYGSIGDIV
ncbi:dGTP triphosphohydrolase [Rubritalea marina]|uniref:dGTP triphosphohydrolase n=1 Tax=Rubritalea marina TaxID=361055 RepID=UPI000361A0EC|nr:dNTP triphosphohydrolase [Rubritalea marina]